MVNKLVALYPIGNAVCEIADSDVGGWKAQTATIYVREGGDWKAKMIYVNNAMPTEPPAQQSMAQQRIEALAALNKQFNDGFLSGDAAAVAALYAQDAVIVSPDSEPIHGRDGIEKHWSDVFKKVHFIKHDRTIEQVADNGLWMTGNWDATFQVENGSAMKINGHYLNILVREEDALKFQVETYNAIGQPVPAETK
jgi:uncharacterized protein (TIGR02246 family)